MKSTFSVLRSAGGLRPWVFTSLLLLVASGVQAVTMRVSSGSGKQGDTVRICVSLESQGQSVAGTQNDLSWDGNCATLVEGNCQIAAPRKQLNAAFPTTFSMRAFVLALDNVDPIPDGDLYCCNFTSELTSAGSCPIRIQGALAAGPDGKAINVSAVGGAIQFAGSDSDRTGGGTGGAAGGVAGGGGVVGGLVGQPGAGGAPQVFQGGGPGVPPTPIVIEPAGQEPPAEEPGEEEELAADETPVATASAGATTVPTEAPTTAPTKVAGTPTSKPTLRPTLPPTAAPTPAKKDDDGGWFSCQLTTGGGSATPLALIAVLGLLALRLKRRRRR